MYNPLYYSKSLRQNAKGGDGETEALEIRLSHRDLHDAFTEKAKWKNGNKRRRGRDAKRLRLTKEERER